MIKIEKSLQALADLCQGKVLGDATLICHGVCAADKPEYGKLAYIGTSQAKRYIDPQQGAYYLVREEDAGDVINGIVHDNPQQAFRLILTALKPKETARIASSAQIGERVQLGNNVNIGAFAVIADDVVLADNVSIGAHCVIEKGVNIGQNTVLGAHVVIGHDVQIGEQCVIKPGAVIGGEGFGFSFEGGAWYAIPQIGSVKIGNGVYIGANSCIDRGAINDTVIGAHVIIDNLVHIAHNVIVGKGSAMAAGVGIAGSTQIGDYCLLAGQVGVVGHIQIASGVQVNGGARVLRSITERGTYAGSFHALPAKEWNRAMLYFKKIGQLFKGKLP